jgi:uncharacterized membrane protein YheB (UPF0754 family)
MTLTFILIPLISAFIGWFTNYIAIKMLFHPRLPKKILGITFQGIFPKNQQRFAQKLGTLVANELINIDDLTQRLKDPKQLQSLAPFIESHIDNFLEVKLKEKMPVISMFVGEGTISKIKEGLLEEIDALLPQLIGKYTDSIKENIDIERIVSDKVAAFSSDKLEEILNSIMKKEFFFVEVIGGVLGFVIGVLQVFITWLQ